MKIRIRFDDTRHLSLNGGYKGGQLSLSMPKWHNLFEKWTHLPDVPYASENARILCAKRKIVRLRMIFHSAENDFACCCKRFYAVCQLHHPYNEIERKKGSHPSFYLRIKWLRWTLHSNSLHRRFTEKFRSALWYNALRWTFSRHSQKRKINALYGSRMKKLWAISSISFRKGSLVAHCTMVMHRKGLSL